MEGAVDLQLQGGSDRLHADDAAEAGQRVAEVGVHLAMLDELLLTLQGHLTDATGPCVQAFTVGHLKGGRGSFNLKKKNPFYIHHTRLLLEKQTEEK